MASQQLLLDTYSLKTLLLALPSLQNAAEGVTSTQALTSKAPPPNAVYAKLIQSKASHIEVILKLVGTPEEMLVERFRMLWPEGQANDLQMLMTLKATKRNDQQVILEMLGLSTTLKKTTNGFAATSGSSQTSGAAVGGTSAGASASSFVATTASYTAASAAASAAAFSSMKSLTQDLSSSARNAVGNLKWTTKN
jgi:hypothetical protein